MNGCPALESRLPADAFYTLEFTWPVLNESWTTGQVFTAGRRALIDLCDEQQLVTLTEPEFTIRRGLVRGEQHCTVLAVSVRVAALDEHGRLPITIAA